MGTVAEEEAVALRGAAGTGSAGPLGWVRLAVRGSLITILTLFVWGASVAARVLLRSWPRRRQALRGWAFRLWGRGMLDILGFDVEVRGAPPAAPCFVISNHVSWIDVPLIASRFDGAFVAKAEIGGWPVAGRITRSLNTIFVDRESLRDVKRVNALVSAALADAFGIVLFPEGGSSRGAVVQQFKSPLLEPARVGGHEVYPACVHYAAPPGRPAPSELICLYGDMGFKDHALRLLRHPGGHRAVLTFGSEPIRGQDRKELAAVGWRAVDALFEPIA